MLNFIIRFFDYHTIDEATKYNICVIKTIRGHNSGQCCSFGKIYYYSNKNTISTLYEDENHKFNIPDDLYLE